ncbi:MAG: response regulator [Magnetococcus sp. YQC-3]
MRLRLCVPWPTLSVPQRGKLCCGLSASLPANPDAMQQIAPLLRLVTVTSAVIALLVVLLPPLIHLLLSLDHANKHLATELRIHTLVLNKFISNHPVGWHVQGIRLQAVLEDAHTPGTSVRVFLLAAGGQRVAAEMAEPLSWPWLTQQKILHDYGEEVGRVDISLPLGPVLLPVLLTLLGSMACGFFLFFPLRNLTVRIVRQATATLQEAKDLAEAASRTKSEFLANMSHELRTPMSAVIGLTDLALQTRLLPQTEDYLHKIASSSRTLLHLLNDILDFSKIEAGKLSLEETDFLLRDLFEQVSDMFRFKAAETQVELVVHVTDACRYALRGDPLRLQQILLNLIGNAFKFTDEGEIELWVTATAAGEDRVTLAFSVRDTGIGMTEEQVARLFVPFTQVDNSAARKFGGTGLGLTICKRLVELMQGRIWVESQPGTGSRFCFSLSLQRRMELETAEMVVPAALQALPVLVVDDNGTARHATQAMLQLFGWKSTGVNSAQEALVQIRRGMAEGNPYALVLVDRGMPEMDGVTAIRQIAEISRGRRPRMILLSHFGQGEKGGDPRSVAGLATVLNKPVPCALLFDTLMEMFGVEFVKTFHRQEDVGHPDQVAEAIGGARVLLVEDNAINRQVAGAILESVGLRVDMAKNGQEAVRMVAEASYDCVLMDVQMPGMDGYEATRRIRADGRFASLPIIAMTAHALSGDREKSLAAGMNDHLTKPISKPQLFAALLHWVPPRAGEERLPWGEPPHQGVAEVGEPVAGAGIAGMDYGAAMERMGGNHALLHAILGDFVRDYGSVTGEIRSALAGRRTDDRKVAHRLAHSVKGIAGNLSAEAVYSAAAQLEESIQEGRTEEWPGLLNHFQEEIDHLLAGIDWFRQNRGACPVAGKREMPSVVAMPEVSPLLREMAALLRRADFAVQQRFDTLKALLAGMEDARVLTCLAEMEAQLDQFAFAPALRTLEGLASLLAVDLEAELP